MAFNAVFKHLLIIIIWLLLWRVSVVMEYAPHASIWFPPAGLTFAAFLLLGWRALATIVTACIISTFWEEAVFQSGRTLLELLKSGLLFAALHTLIYGVSGHLLRGTLKKVNSYNLYQLVMRFFMIVGVSSLTMALSGVYLLYGGATLTTFRDTWVAWWIGDMSGILVLAPMFIGLINRFYPQLGLQPVWSYQPVSNENQIGYVSKLLINSALLVAITGLASHFESAEIACFVFFLAIPQMWIVYTESPLRTAASLALFSFLTAALVTLFGMDQHAYIYQFAINVIASSAYFAMAVPALVSDNKVLYKRAHIDFLTKAYTRQHFFHLAEEHAKQAQRYEQETALILFDVDRFKQINDEHGHTLGDKVLETLASLVHSELRSSDIFGRFGGDEFMILLPHTSVHSAFNVAEQLRQLAAREIESTMGISVSCSFGVAAVKPESGVDEAFELADKQLLAAKRAGRNQTLSEPLAD